MMQILGLTDTDAGEFFDERATMFERHYKRLSAMPTMTRHKLTAALNAARQEYPNNEGMKDELQHSFDILEPFHCDVFMCLGACAGVHNQRHLAAHNGFLGGR